MAKVKMTLTIEPGVVSMFKLICAARQESVSQHLEDYMRDYIVDNYDDILEQLAETGLKNIKK